MDRKREYHNLMAHFAELDENNKVLRVIVVANEELLDDNGEEKEEIGLEFCKKHFGGNWVQTSYNGKIRKNYAGIDFTYSQELDAFIPPCDHPSWTLDTETCTWKPPKPMPSDGNIYLWSESELNWIEFVFNN